MQLKTKAAREAKEGDMLFKHRVRLSRKVEYTQSDEVVIITTAKEISDNEYQEIWDSIDEEDLPTDHLSWDESDHLEEVLDSVWFVERCKYTMDMF
jgi:hypothetical protein